MLSVKSLHIAFELWGVVFCAIAVLCVSIGDGMSREKRRYFVLMQLTAALLLLADAFAWGFRGREGTLGYYVVRVANFFVFFLSDLLLFCYHSYVCSNLFPGNKRASQMEVPKRVKAVYGIALSGMVLVIVSQFTGLYYHFDSQNVYSRSAGYPLSVIIPMAGMALDISLIIQYRKNIKRRIAVSMASYVVLPAVGCLLLLFYYGVAYVNIAISISMVLMFVAAMTEQNRELAQTRIEVMLSQINPHFIYNVLAGISGMCRENPDMAAETVEEFARYLRGNVDCLATTKNISFKQELEHTRVYLKIEQKRFGEKLHIVWDIQETDFELPALTLQPLVENAVRYGITKKADGGTIRIYTYRAEDAFYIGVEDNGAGFDVRAVQRDGREHTGINNVRSRLHSLCGGTLTIQSTVGEGTVAEICIPSGKMRRKKEKGRWFACVCAVIFAASVIAAGHSRYETYKDAQALKEQQELLLAEKEQAAKKEETETAETEMAETETETEQANELQILPEYEMLYEQNNDLVGWLTIPDTKINYPVMQTMEDEQYYLYRDFNGEENANGCLIMDTDSTVGAGTVKPSTNLIIHGHTMKSGEMFGDLNLYADEGYEKEHAVIFFDSLYEHRTYEVIAVFYSQVYYETDTVFKYYKFFQADTPEEFAYWYDNIRELSLYQTGVTADFGDEFLTLSCCAYHVKNGRFVVVGKRTA